MGLTSAYDHGLQTVYKGTGVDTTEKVQWGMRETPQYIMSAIPKINSETTVEIYSIDKNVINLNGTRDLIQRSGPVRLSEGLRVAREWEDRGHVIEVRRVSQRSS